MLGEGINVGVFCRLYVFYNVLQERSVENEKTGSVLEFEMYLDWARF
jgi:hypothetical protein